MTAPKLSDAAIEPVVRAKHAAYDLMTSACGEFERARADLGHGPLANWCEIQGHLDKAERDLARMKDFLVQAQQALDAAAIRYGVTVKGFPHDAA